MTVAEAGPGEGRLIEVEREAALDSDEPDLRFSETAGRINADLTVGADVSSVAELLANQGLSYNGMMLAGQGFKIDERTAELFRQDAVDSPHTIIRPYINGVETLRGWSRKYAIDFTGLTETEARQRYPRIYQHVVQTVKPERDRNRDAALTQRWWLFGRNREGLRSAIAGHARYIATAETSKHRVFQFFDAQVLPDHGIIAVGSGDAYHLGVLSSRVHSQWAIRAGGWLGIGNDSRYSKSRVFEPFPFPAPTHAQRACIAELAEELDVTRKHALAEVPRLTMTELYNLRARIAAGEDLKGADLDRATAARAFIVHRLHEQIDAAVAEAYGWPHDLAPAEIVARLVALNAERKAEEEDGKVRWLRPEYQKPRFGNKKGRHEVNS